MDIAKAAHSEVHLSLDQEEGLHFGPLHVLISAGERAFRKHVEASAFGGKPRE